MDTLLTSEQYPYDQYHTLSFVRQKQRDGVRSSEHCPTGKTNAITRKVQSAQSVSTHSTTMANHLCEKFICKGLFSSGK